jgi:hypothetical protein
MAASRGGHVLGKSHRELPDFLRRALEGSISQHELHRYVFFNSPQFPNAQRLSKFERDGVQVRWVELLTRSHSSAATLATKAVASAGRETHGSCRADAMPGDRMPPSLWRRPGRAGLAGLAGVI